MHAILLIQHGFGLWTRLVMEWVLYWLNWPSEHIVGRSAVCTTSLRASHWLHLPIPIQYNNNFDSNWFITILICRPSTWFAPDRLPFVINHVSRDSCKSAGPSCHVNINIVAHYKSLSKNIKHLPSPSSSKRMSRTRKTKKKRITKTFTCGSVSRMLLPLIAPGQFRFPTTEQRATA